MLENLYIKNIALIDKVEISFSPLLNILSGETGAGKSIVIDSINFVLGGKVTKDIIRSGEECAMVQALFSINDTSNKKAFLDAGIDIEEDNSVLISRELFITGKSTIRINSRVVTLSILKELTPLFIDLHGQHEHQSLLNPNKHIELVDKFCGIELDELKTQLSVLFKKYKDIAKEINSIAGDDKDRLATLDLLSFQIKEIEKAKLKLGEEDSLVERRDIINSSEKLLTAVGGSLELLYGSNSDELSAIDKISKSLNYVTIIKEIDNSKMEISEKLSNVLAELEDVVEELRDYFDGLEHDPSEIENIEKRLDTIYSLKRKYGSNIKEILEYYEKSKTRYTNILNSEELIAKLNDDKKIIEKEIIGICNKMSTLRKLSASIIEKEIINSLIELGMKNVEFKIEFERKNSFTLNGFDKTEFMISPNKGEPLKQLSKTASGGEMSRVMLALKSVLADVDNIETFIFDEIDTGVSGRTAQKVAEKLAFLSRKHQILCITHLPQIASMADNHYLIEKKVEDSRTITRMKQLADNDILSELARLTGGAQITESTIKAVEEMKNMTVEFKGNIV